MKGELLTAAAHTELIRVQPQHQAKPQVKINHLHTGAIARSSFGCSFFSS